MTNESQNRPSTTDEPQEETQEESVADETNKPAAADQINYDESAQAAIAKRLRELGYME